MDDCAQGQLELILLEIWEHTFGLFGSFLYNISLSDMPLWINVRFASLQFLQFPRFSMSVECIGKLWMLNSFSIILCTLNWHMNLSFLPKFFDLILGLGSPFLSEEFLQFSLQFPPFFQALLDSKNSKRISHCRDFFASFFVEKCLETILAMSVIKFFRFATMLLLWAIWWNVIRKVETMRSMVRGRKFERYMKYKFSKNVS